MITLKKCLTFFIFAAERPFSWLWRAILHPLLTLVYRLYLAVRQVIRIHLLSLEKFNTLLTRRWAANIGILILTFLITATNLYASTGSQDTNIDGNKSLIAKLNTEFEDDLLVEEADGQMEVAPDVSYLDGQALSAQEADQASNSTLPEDDILPDDEDEESVATQLNAIWSQPEAMTAEFVVPTRTEIVEYAVADGDTVESIARSYGLRSATVLQANNLGTRGIIRIGQKLRIPPVDGVIYKIKKGDTLEKIAKTYKSDVAKITEYNRLAEGSLQVGTEVVLPGGRLPAPPPAPASGQYAAGFNRNGSVAVDSRIPILLWPTTSRRITQYYKRGHTGLDIGGPMRSPLFAAESGKVIYAGWNTGGYGNMVIIDHGGGLYTRYGHSTKLLVKVGDVVSRGDTIALLGSTGRSTGPHLHFEVMTGSISHRLNPLDYVK